MLKRPALAIPLVLALVGALAMSAAGAAGAAASSAGSPQPGSSHAVYALRHHRPHVRVTTVIHNAAGDVITSAKIGSKVHAAAYVRGRRGTPTGTVRFTWYTSKDCTTGGSASGVVRLVHGVAHPSHRQTVPVGGGSFRAHYSGNRTYPARNGACTLLTVTAAPVPVTLVSIAVSPATPSIVAGTDQRFTATGTYSDATTADLSATATWASSDASATIGATGLAHGVSAGTSTIGATSGLVSGSTLLTVTAAPVPATVKVLGNVQAIFANGNFVLTSGPSTYTVVMSPDTSIVNLLGHIVPSQFIAVNGSVEVTGPLSGSTIQAQLVVVQNTIDF